MFPLICFPRLMYLHLPSSQRKICFKIAEVNSTVKRIWQESPPPPSPARTPSPHLPRATPLPIRSPPPPTLSSAASPFEEPLMSSRHDVGMDYVQSGGNPELGSPSERIGQSSPREEKEGMPLLEQLSSRGSGSYRCPEGENCTKGGKHSDGRIRTFSRNSEFK